VFADKLVVYSYYKNFLTLSTSSNPVLEKENQHLLYVMFDRQFFWHRIIIWDLTGMVYNSLSSEVK